MGLFAPAAVEDSLDFIVSGDAIHRCTYLQRQAVSAYVLDIHSDYSTSVWLVGVAFKVHRACDIGARPGEWIDLFSSRRSHSSCVKLVF